jgi:hypothetical protein
MAIGQDLLDVPFPDMVHNLARAIAEGQLELDRSAIRTLQFLIDNTVEVVTEITDVISPVERTVTIPGTLEVVAYTGAEVVSSGAAPVQMSLLQAGLTPTFYQFTEATIAVKMSITARSDTQETSSGTSRVPTGLRLYASPVDYRTSSTYSYTAEGASALTATIKPVPPPSRITPTHVTVDALSRPPRVTSVG